MQVYPQNVSESKLCALSYDCIPVFFDHNSLSGYTPLQHTSLEAFDWHALHPWLTTGLPYNAGPRFTQGYEGQSSNHHGVRISNIPINTALDHTSSRVETDQEYQRTFENTLPGLDTALQDDVLPNTELPVSSQMTWCFTPRAVAPKGAGSKRVVDVNALMQILAEPDSSTAERACSQPAGGRDRKPHMCTSTGCNKAFRQATHLKIHLRSHTGEKPYRCGVAGCGAAFAQLGNLRTHERRHDGLQPKRRSRQRLHNITTHGSTGYECRLDNCRPRDGERGKMFSHLGNLKAHMNKFHGETLAQLCIQFQHQSEESDEVSLDGGYELKEYFRSLYKNCNKGIKGRGKGRRVIRYNGNT